MTTEEKEKTAEEAEQEGEGQTEEIAAEKEEGQEETQAISSELLLEMTKAGLFYGRGKTKTYPKMRQFILTTRSGIEVINLEKTAVLMEKAVVFLKEVAEKGGKVMLVGTQPAARNAIKELALKFNFPYVADKWVGGTLTNFAQIRKRVEKLEKLTSEKEKGELAKYTKKERLLIDREIANLERFFSGIVSMRELPKALFIVDPKKEKTAVKEALDMHIPVIALSGSDCNIRGLTYPIVGNDASQTSIQFFMNEICKAYSDGKALGKSEGHSDIVKTEVGKV